MACNQPAQFFILGRPRSGTTLLKTLFDAHPNVKIPPELPVFPMLYRKFRHVKTWDQNAIDAFIDAVFEPRRFNLRSIDNFMIDREAFRQDLMTLGESATIRQLLFKINEHSHSLFEKKEILMVGDKNPVYSVFSRQLNKQFPEAKFICIVRDFRDNYISLKSLTSVTLEAPVLPLQVIRWRNITELFLDLKAKYPERYYQIRYEDLVADPQEEFRKICAFLEIPYDPIVFDFHLKKDELSRMFPDPRIREIHKSLPNPVSTSRTGLWKNSLSPEENQLAVRLAGKTGFRLGYVDSAIRLSLSDYIRTSHWRLYSRIVFSLMVLATQLPYGPNKWISGRILYLARFYRKMTTKTTIR